MHAAQDYVAVDSGDRIVFGPTTDYREAKLHADRVGGVVKFAVAAAEEVKNAKFERCVQHVKRESPGANPWAVCHSVLGEANEAAGKSYSIFFANKKGQVTRNGPFFDEDPFAPGNSRGPHYRSLDPNAYSEVDLPTTRYADPPRSGVYAGKPIHEFMPWGEARLVQASEANEAPHHCSVDSMTQVAQQIPGGPWKHEGAYPPGAKARVDHQKEHSVTVDGASKTIAVRYCGSHIILTCPRSGEQHLFQKACIADTPPGKPQRGKIPTAPGIEPSKKEPFVLRVRKGRSTTTEKGPFALITDAVDAMQQVGAPGETATIYDGSKVAMYRGARATFSFGRTRWSRLG